MKEQNFKALKGMVDNARKMLQSARLISPQAFNFYRLESIQNAVEAAELDGVKKPSKFLKRMIKATGSNDLQDFSDKNGEI